MDNAKLACMLPGMHLERPFWDLQAASLHVKVGIVWDGWVAHQQDNGCSLEILYLPGWYSCNDSPLLNFWTRRQLCALEIHLLPDFKDDFQRHLGIFLMAGKQGSAIDLLPSCA